MDYYFQPTPSPYSSPSASSPLTTTSNYPPPPFTSPKHSGIPCDVPNCRFRATIETEDKASRFCMVHLRAEIVDVRSELLHYRPGHSCQNTPIDILYPHASATANYHIHSQKQKMAYSPPAANTWKSEDSPATIARVNHQVMTMVPPRRSPTRPHYQSTICLGTQPQVHPHRVPGIVDIERDLTILTECLRRGMHLVCASDGPELAPHGHEGQDQDQNKQTLTTVATPIATRIVNGVVTPPGSPDMDDWSETTPTTGPRHVLDELLRERTLRRWWGDDEDTDSIVSCLLPTTTPTVASVSATTSTSLDDMALEAAAGQDEGGSDHEDSSDDDDNSVLFIDDDDLGESELDSDEDIDDVITPTAEMSSLDLDLHHHHHLRSNIPYMPGAPPAVYITGRTWWALYGSVESFKESAAFRDAARDVDLDISTAIATARRWGVIVVPDGSCSTPLSALPGLSRPRTSRAHLHSDGAENPFREIMDNEDLDLFNLSPILRIVNIGRPWLILPPGAAFPEATLRHLEHAGLGDVSASYMTVRSGGRSGGFERNVRRGTQRNMTGTTPAALVPSGRKTMKKMVGRKREGGGPGVNPLGLNPVWGIDGELNARWSGELPAVNFTGKRVE